VLVWWLGGSSRLSLGARQAIEGAEVIYVSAATAWEIATKVRQGKLALDGDLREQMLPAGFQPLAIRIDHAIAAAELPMHHRDPFDRLLVAQAQIESLALLTSDSMLQAYDARVLLI
jgi:PIN domain nuclease of toxin-antitoxin system